VHGLSARALETILTEAERELVARARATRIDGLAPAVRAELPDWLWERLVAEHGEEQAMKIARGSLNPAPLDLRVNIARIGRDEALAQLRSRGFECAHPLLAGGNPLAGRPQINRDELFCKVSSRCRTGQSAARLPARPAAHQMVADFCAGASGGHRG
jgi:16S rRNA (cytosine967-C5)-methyltransferase